VLLVLDSSVALFYRIAKTGNSAKQVWEMTDFLFQGGGVSQARSLCLLGGDYILSGEQSKPIIHVWPANSHEPSFELRSICSGAVNALAASPNALWVAGAVDDKVHVWQVQY